MLKVCPFLAFVRKRLGKKNNFTGLMFEDFNPCEVRWAHWSNCNASAVTFAAFDISPQARHEEVARDVKKLRGSEKW